ncbi:Nn.00g105420.m01.CDS01 [Neocucurbitaria sp. VM-36]
MQVFVSAPNVLVASDTNLASFLQNQMLACLRWLGQFQILAFIPQLGSIAFRDIAELADVPEAQLRRIVRMTAAAGFLHELQPGHVEHTALSAPFAPAAMQMVSVTQRVRHQQLLLLQGSAYNDLPLASSFQQQATPRRQWPSYLKYALGDQDSSIASILNSFDWANLGEATVVDIGARSTAMASALAQRYPSLKFVVQMSDSLDPPTELDSRIVVQSRSWAMPQIVRDATIYALRVPYDYPTIFAQTRPARLRAELEAHLGVLRDNNAARLILTAPLLPHSDAADDVGSDVFQPNVDAAKGLVFDMTLLQLANDRELNVADLSELVRNVGDSNGHLVLEGKWQAHPASRDQAFEIRYQSGMP